MSDDVHVAQLEARVALLERLNGRLKLALLFAAGLLASIFFTLQ